MNTPAVAAPDREYLLMRSALCRLQLERQARHVRDSLRWPRLAATAVSAPAARRIALGVFFAWLGPRRVARILLLASRVLLVARLARPVARYMFKLPERKTP